MNLDFYFPEWLDNLYNHRTHYEKYIQNIRADLKKNRISGDVEIRETLRAAKSRRQMLLPKDQLSSSYSTF